MKRIFILEDMVIRQEAFKKTYEGYDLVIIDNAKDAIDFLSKDLNFDIMFLDHDLGNRIFVKSEDENTGYQVAKFLQNKDFKGTIVIHSMNYGGAKNMLSLLPNAQYIPFAMFFLSKELK